LQLPLAFAIPRLYPYRVEKRLNNHAACVVNDEIVNDEADYISQNL